MQIVKPPLLIRSFYPKAIWRVPTKEKVVFLTFDDGPTPDVTENVLNLLKKYNAKATFFCIGKNVVKYPTIYQRILSEQHKVGNHTYNHLKGSQTTNQDYYDDIDKCSMHIQSNLFRPPYGRLKKSQYKRLKKQYKIIFWNVLSWDFDLSITPDACANNVIKNTKSGSIIVFHDSNKAKRNCLYALEKTLEYFSQKGYCFESIVL